MVDLPDEYMVHLKDDSFKKMKNLKILIVRKGQFYGSPQHLPNNLRLLDWMEYPSSSLPSSFHPKKLVLLNLSRSRCTMQEPFKVYSFCPIITMIFEKKQFLRSLFENYYSPVNIYDKENTPMINKNNLVKS